MVKLTLMGIENQQAGEVVYVNPSAVSHVVPYPQINPGGCYVHLGSGSDGYGYYARESALEVVTAIEEH
jgi:hypothetical protein